MRLVKWAGLIARLIMNNYAVPYNNGWHIIIIHIIINVISGYYLIAFLNHPIYTFERTKLNTQNQFQFDSRAMHFGWEECRKLVIISLEFSIFFIIIIISILKWGALLKWIVYCGILRTFMNNLSNARWRPSPSCLSSIEILWLSGLSWILLFSQFEFPIVIQSNTKHKFIVWARWWIITEVIIIYNYTVVETDTRGYLNVL